MNKKHLLEYSDICSRERYESEPSGAWLNRCLGTKAVNEIQTFYTQAFYGQFDFNKCTKELEKAGAILIYSAPSLTRKLPQASYVWEDTVVNLIQDDRNDKSGHIEISSVAKKRFDNLCKNFRFKFTRVKEEGRVYVLIPSPEGITVETLGMANVPLERDNYSQDVLDGYDQIVSDLTNKNPIGRLSILDGIPGSGKAQPLDAKILTPTGWTTMGEIRPGDDILTPEGLIAQVESVYPQGELDIYRIYFSDDSFTECCADHLWEVQTSGDRDKKSSRGTLRTETKSRVLDLKTINKKIRSSDGKRQYSIPMVSNLDIAQSEALPIDPYLLGLLIGDGGFTTGALSFTTVDQELLKKVEELLPAGVSMKKRQDKITYGLSCDGNSNRTNPNPLTKALRDLGLFGHKSDKKFIPDIYKFNSKENRLSMLQGLMDTDGTIDKNRRGGSRGGGTTFTSTSRALAFDVQFLVESLGGKATIRTRIPQYTYLGEEKDGLLAYTVFISMPKDLRPFRLQRKLDRFKPKTKYPPTRYIDKIELIGKKPAQCIKINSPKQLYITDRFIVTHNTYITRSIIGCTEDAMFIMLPSHMAANLGDPSLVACLINLKDKGKTLCLIIEDADSCLSRRAADNMSSISALLNTSDGILGHLIDIRIICTTNAEIEHIDEAILRPGRLSARVEVGSLDHEHAGRVYKRLTGEDKEFKKGFYTLAEVYSMTKKGVSFNFADKQPKQQVGFSAKRFDEPTPAQTEK